MSNSSLVNYTKISPMCSPREGKISKITIHHMAGNLTVESCGNVFQTREASTNYGIGTDGRIGMYVPENYRAWSTANPANDHISVNMEVANDGGSATNWHVSDKAIESCINLCVDICRRNGIKQINYTGDKSGNLTRHNMFMSTSCPGPYLQSKFPYIASEINKRLGNGYVPTKVAESKTPTIQFGSEGSAVKSVQTRLIALGYSCGSAGADGDFGSGTQAAVIKFQKAMKIDADGIVGPDTYAALDKAEKDKKATTAAKTTTTTAAKKTTTVAYDATPDDIKEVQVWLNENYDAKLAVDGGYGPLTKAAIVKAVQAHIGTPVDGVFGPNSKAKWTSLLQKGYTGRRVQLVQCMLICQGYSVGSDGADSIFGNDTYSAIIRFQKAKGLQVDGVVGKETAYALFH